MRQREKDQPAGRRRLQHRTYSDDDAAIDAVRDVARRQGQQHDGQELREADIAERHRAFGDVVDLPAHRHRLDQHGERAEEASRYVEPEIAQPEKAGRRVLGGVGGGR